MATIIVVSLVFSIVLVVVSFQLAFGEVERMVNDQRQRQDIEEGRIIYIQAHMARYWQIREQAEIRNQMDALVDKLTNKKIDFRSNPDA